MNPLRYHFLGYIYRMYGGVNNNISANTYNIVKTNLIMGTKATAQLLSDPVEMREQGIKTNAQALDYAFATQRISFDKYYDRSFPQLDISVYLDDLHWDNLSSDAKNLYEGSYEWAEQITAGLNLEERTRYDLLQVRYNINLIEAMNWMDLMSNSKGFILESQLLFEQSLAFIQ